MGVYCVATPEIAATIDDLNKLNELKERLLTQEERLKLAVMSYRTVNKIILIDNYSQS